SVQAEARDADRISLLSSSRPPSAIIQWRRGAMRHLYIRHEQTVVDPLQQERLLRALRIILEHREDTDASRTLCQSVNTPSATGGHHCQPGALTPTAHSPAGLEPTTRP